VYAWLALAFDAAVADTQDKTLGNTAKDGSMKLLGGLFGSGSAPAKLAPAVRQHATRPAGGASRTVQVRLSSAQLLIRSGSYPQIQIEGPIKLENGPDGVLVTERFVVPGPPPICRLEVPEGLTIDLQLASGGLTVRNFRGTLLARVQNGTVSVEQSEGRFRVVVPTGRVDFERVRGEIDILTGNGSVAARQTHGGLQTVSTGGAMEFEDIDGPIVARTTNGSIQASDLRGTARLSTRTGEVHVSGTCGPLTVRTQGGDVSLDGSVVAHTTLETHKGSLYLKLGAHTNAHIEARVGQGMVRAERLTPLPGSSRRTLRTTLGLGQARLRLTSGLGVINVAGPPLQPRPKRAAAASV
jgi:hypothetical protein